MNSIRLWGTVALLAVLAALAFIELSGGHTGPADSEPAAAPQSQGDDNALKNLKVN